MTRSADCSQIAAAIRLSEYQASSEDEAYFKTWEALNAIFVTQAENGVAKANCTFANNEITVYV